MQTTSVFEQFFTSFFEGGTNFENSKIWCDFFRQIQQAQQGTDIKLTSCEFAPCFSAVGSIPPKSSIPRPLDDIYMDVSENSGFSPPNHPFW